MPDNVHSAASYVASTAATLAGLTFNEWVALAGLFIGLVTCMTNLYYKRKQYLLQRQELTWKQKNGGNAQPKPENVQSIR